MDITCFNIGFAMDIKDENGNNSDCEVVFENDVLSKAKQNNNTNQMKDGKPPTKKRSIWWNHFTQSDVVDVAECIYCHRKIGCSTKNGTTPMKNHINTCKMYPANIDKKQKLIVLESKTRVSDDASVEKITELNQEVIRKALAKMLIAEELPFTFVEREGFREFCKVINPHFVVPSRLTATRDCYSYFIEERKKLVDIFKTMSSKVCLTVDTWTSDQNLCYMCLSAHFIDDEWRLHKKIINFCPVIGHSGVIIGRAVEKCLVEWGLKNVLTVTVDNASSNDVAIQYLQNVLNQWDCGVLKGEFLHMRCAGHILNLVVKDGLCSLSLSIKKIRALVKYVRSSPARLQKFKDCAEEENIESTSLVCLDVETQWNTTILMLESAVKFKEAFSNLLSKDSQCEMEMKKCEGGLIHENDWKGVHSLLPFLKIFYDATLRFSGTRYVTSNTYVTEIFGIGMVIDDFTRNNDTLIKSMAVEVRKNYNKYWGDVNKLNHFLFIAKVLDPRWKWQFIEFLIQEKFVDESIGLSLDSNLRTLFEVYKKDMPIKEKSFGASEVCGDEAMDAGEIMSRKFEMAMQSLESSSSKNELDKYLGEEREPTGARFDILQWWKVHQCRYPILAKMARDILAIPVSTIGSESAFSTGGRVFGGFRTSLTPKLVEALVCAQDWLRASNSKIRIEDTLLEIENMEAEGLKDLVMEQPMIIIDETVEESF